MPGSIDGVNMMFSHELYLLPHAGHICYAGKICHMGTLFLLTDGDPLPKGTPLFGKARAN